MERSIYINKVKMTVGTLLLMLCMLMANVTPCYADSGMKTPADYLKSYKSLMGNVSPTDCVRDLTLAKAIDTLSREALEKYPYNSIAHELRGHYYYYLAGFNDKGNLYKENERLTQSSANYYEKARYHYIKALHYDDGNINARQRMLGIETALHEYSAALIYCNELLETSPYDDGLWRRKINLYRLMGNDVEADRLTQRYMAIFTDDIKFKQGEAERKLMAMNDTTDTYGYRAMAKEKTLREMVALHPKHPEYYYYLINHLAGKGRMEDALAETGTAIQMCRDCKPDTIVAEDRRAKNGLFVRNDTAFIRVDRNWFVHRRIEILCDLNRAQEAESYLLNLQKQEGVSYASLLSNVRLSMAESARMSDPYEAYAHTYAKNKNIEALNYLVSTSLKRGYYEDALGYIHDMQKRSKDYKWMLAEYDVLKRLGYTSRANVLQERLLDTLPQDTIRYIPLCDFMQARMQEAKSLVAEGNYRHAIHQLRQLLAQNTAGVAIRDDNTFVQYRESAWSNLYTCYLNTKQYPQAEEALDTLYGYYRQGKDMDNLLYHVDLYCAKDDKGRALQSLYSYIQDNPSDTKDISATYEEIALSYIKDLIDNKLMLKADTAVELALKVCPDNIDLLTCGVNIAGSLQDNHRIGKGTLRERVDCGYDIYPQSRFFRIKKAQMLQSDRLYDEAAATITPLLDNYIGDSVIIGVYADNTYLWVDTLLRENRSNKINSKEYKALLDSVCHVISTASHLVPNTPRLMQAYGRYYEAMSKYDYKHTLAYKDSAYQAYRLCKGEFDSPAEYRRVTNQLYNDSRHNELSFEYQHGVSGEDASRTGTAFATYKRVTDRGDELTAALAYAGRSGADVGSMTVSKGGGIGVLVAAGYLHNFSQMFTGEVYAAYSTRYFPQVTAKLGATWHLGKQWDFNIHASYRRIKDYNANLFQGGVSAAKVLGEQFRLQVGADAFFKGTDQYFNGNIKCQYYPVVGSKNHFFVSGGAGTAPDGLLLDKAHTLAFNDINGFVSMGGYILLTRNIGVGLSGTWNTIYADDGEKGPQFVNFFYVNANVVIKF